MTDNNNLPIMAFIVCDYDIVQIPLIENYDWKDFEQELEIMSKVPLEVLQKLNNGDTVNPDFFIWDTYKTNLSKQLHLLSEQGYIFKYKGKHLDYCTDTNLKLFSYLFDLYKNS